MFKFTFVLYFGTARKKYSRDFLNFPRDLKIDFEDLVLTYDLRINTYLTKLTRSTATLPNTRRL